MARAPEFENAAPVPDSIELDATLRLLVDRFGSSAIKLSLRRAAKRPLGRKRQDDDWIKLDPILKDEARLWLECKVSERENGEIAKWFADNFHRGVMTDRKSVIRRIRDKLKRDRHYYTLVEAFWMSQAGYPYRAHLRTLTDLSSGLRSNAMWRSQLQRVEETVAAYEARLGKPPEDLTWNDLEVAVAAAWITQESARRRNVFRDIRGDRTV